MNILYKKLIAPRSTDPDLKNREVVLNWLLVGSLGLSLAALLNAFTNFLLLGEAFLLSRVLMVGLVLVLFAVLLGLSRWKQQIFVSYTLIIIFFVAAGSVLYRWGPVNPVGILVFSLVIIMSGILLGARYSLYSALLTSLLLAGIEYAKAHSYIAPDLSWMRHPSSFTDVVTFTAIYLIIALVSWLFNRQMEHALGRALRSEKALKRQRDLLEVKVEERTRELQRTQLEKVQQFYRFAELGRLSTALFHDLASHLMSVSVDIQGLKARQQSNILERIQENIHYIDTVVQRVHQQMQGRRKPERFRVIKETDEIIKIMYLKANSHKVRIDFQAPNIQPSFSYTADLTRFRQLISNLISNAIDAYQGAQGTNADRSVVVMVERTQVALVISVTDRGAGISPKVQTRIFEPFYTTKEKGIGIGLFIAKQVAEQDFKGTITLISNKLQGTSFIVTLPFKFHAKKT